MSLADLFNFPVETEIVNDPAPMAPGGLEPTGSGGSTQQRRRTTATGSTFITPQVLAAYPLASGLVAGFWKASQRLLHLPDDSLWVCFAIAMVLAFFTFFVSMTDPRLKATTREKWIGIGFAVLNGFYLFTTAIGISMAVKK